MEYVTPSGSSAAVILFAPTLAASDSELDSSANLTADDAADPAAIDVLRGPAGPASAAAAELRWSALGLSVIIVATAVGNILVCLAVCFERRLQNMTNYFLMSLAIADLLVSLLVMPLGMVVELFGFFPLEPSVCVIWASMDVLLCTASIWHMCTMSMDRYCTIRYPIRYGRNRTKSTVALKIAFVWIISIAVCSFLGVAGFVDYSNVYVDGQCVPSLKDFILYGSIMAFYVPLVIMVVTYALTVRILAQNRKTMKTLGLHPTSGDVSAAGDLTRQWVPNGRQSDVDLPRPSGCSGRISGGGIPKRASLGTLSSQNDNAAAVTSTTVPSPYRQRVTYSGDERPDFRSKISIGSLSTQRSVDSKYASDDAILACFSPTEEEESTSPSSDQPAAPRRYTDDSPCDFEDLRSIGDPLNAADSIAFISLGGTTVEGSVTTSTDAVDDCFPRSCSSLTGDRNSAAKTSDNVSCNGVHTDRNVGVHEQLRASGSGEVTPAADRKQFSWVRCVVGADEEPHKAETVEQPSAKVSGYRRQRSEDQSRDVGAFQLHCSVRRAASLRRLSDGAVARCRRIFGRQSTGGGGLGKDSDGDRSGRTCSNGVRWSALTEDRSACVGDDGAVVGVAVGGVRNVGVVASRRPSTQCDGGNNGYDSADSATNDSDYDWQQATRRISSTLGQIRDIYSIGGAESRSSLDDRGRRAGRHQRPAATNGVGCRGGRALAPPTKHRSTMSASSFRRRFSLLSNMQKLTRAIIDEASSATSEDVDESASTFRLTVGGVGINRLPPSSRYQQSKQADLCDEDSKRAAVFALSSSTNCCRWDADTSPRKSGRAGKTSGVGTAAGATSGTTKFPFRTKKATTSSLESVSTAAAIAGSSACTKIATANRRRITSRLIAAADKHPSESQQRQRSSSSASAVAQRRPSAFSRHLMPWAKSATSARPPPPSTAATAVDRSADSGSVGSLSTSWDNIQLAAMRRRCNSATTSSSGGEQRISINLVKRRRSVATNERKASKVLGIIFAVFVILWTPFFVVNVLSVVCEDCMQALGSTAMASIVWLGYVSSLANPIIYTMFSTSFRTVFYQILTCRQCGRRSGGGGVAGGTAGGGTGYRWTTANHTYGRRTTCREGFSSRVFQQEATGLLSYHGGCLQGNGQQISTVALN